MLEKQKSKPAAGSDLRFQLFIAGNNTHSLSAQRNLREFCKGSLSSPWEIETVDVFHEGRTALDAGIFLTPALVIFSEGVRVPGILYGNLSKVDSLENWIEEIQMDR